MDWNFVDLLLKIADVVFCLHQFVEKLYQGNIEQAQLSILFLCF